MPQQYTGNRTNLQTPSQMPNDGVSPVGVLPLDGEWLTVSSIEQALKVLLDFSDYCTHRFTTFPGVRAYESTRTYTEGMMCLDSDGHTYRVKQGQTSTGEHPYSSPTKWERWGFSPSELDEQYAPTVDGGNGVWKGPGLWIQWESLTSSQLPTGSQTSKTHMFATPFPNTCFAAFFQAKSWDNVPAGLTPALLVAVLGKTSCQLTLPNYENTTWIDSGYLISIGN